MKYLRGLKYALYVGKIMNTAVEAVLCHHYNGEHKSEAFKGIVYVADGSLLHGGLSDRLRACVSLFYVAQKLNIPFRIYFQSPFALEDYFIPSKYDWRIDETSMSYSLSDTNVVYIYSRDLPFEHLFQWQYLKRRIDANMQNHVFTNIDLGDKCFSKLFNMLFKPSYPLQQAVKLNEGEIGGDYISMVFRFQQLLGDFKEGNFKILGIEERKKLMEKCKDAICYQHSIYPNMKILVTSDSIGFLDYIKDLEYVYTIKGKVFHMDFTNETQKMQYLKSFVDLLMLSKSKYIFLVKSSEMYASGFAKRASLINNVPYSVLNI